MIALAQGCAGLALVMGFALLRSGQVSAAAILLAVQSAAVAVTACVLHQPLMAVPPLVLGGGIWLIRHRVPMLEPGTAPVGGAKLGIGVGAVLTVLCQSQGSLALPGSIVLLSVLLAATRPHPLVQVMALVGAQNGVALAGSLVTSAVDFPAGLLVPAACLVLPLPLAAGLLLPALVGSAGRRTGWGRAGRLAGAVPWVDLGLAVAMLAATVVAPLGSLASLFAPLLALDGVLRAWGRRNRPAVSLLRRGAVLAQTGLTVLAVCQPNLVVAWISVLGALAMALLPVVARRWGEAVLASVAAGLALFGMVALSGVPSVLGYFSLFAGFAAIAAVVPDLAVVLVILVLRLADRAVWLPSVAALGIGIAAIGLLGCALLLIRPARPHRTSLLVLSQASLAAMSLCIGSAEGRFAALVLLILLILSRSAARFSTGPAGMVAMAGLGGVPPLGVFPGLVLVVLAIGAREPWLLVPLGAGLVPIVWASVPRRIAGGSWRMTVPSIAWLPLLLAVLAGWFAPDSLVHWWRVLAAGGP